MYKMTTNLASAVDLYDAVNNTDLLKTAQKLTGAYTNDVTSETNRATQSEAVLGQNNESILKVQPYFSVYANAEKPTTIPEAYKLNSTFSNDGWYFKNDVASKKINWYMPNVSTLKAGFVNLCLDVHLFNVSSRDGLPFITVYTKPTGVNDLGTWYHAANTYIINDKTLVEANRDYVLYTHEPPPSGSNGKRQVKLTLDSVSSKGTISSTDSIVAISIDSSSNAPVNTAEFCIDKFRVVTPTCTRVFELSGATTQSLAAVNRISDLESIINNYR
jgi:hypothetical protein